MLDESSSTFLVLLMLTVWPVTLAFIGHYARNPHKRWKFDRKKVWCGEASWVLTLLFYFGLGALVCAVGALNIQAVDFTVVNHGRLAGFWTFAVAVVLLLTAVALSFVWEEPGWATVVLFLSFATTIASAALVGSYSGEPTEWTCMSLSILMALLLFGAFIVTCSITRHGELTHAEHETQHLVVGQQHASHRSSRKRDNI